MAQSPARNKSFGSTVKSRVNRVKGSRNRNGDSPVISRVKNELRSASVPLEREDSTDSLVIGGHDAKSCSEIDINSQAVEDENTLSQLIERVIMKFGKNVSNLCHR